MCNIHQAYGKFACKLTLCGVCREDSEEAERRTKRESDEGDSVGDADEALPKK
jgi:hypothetical protein